MSWVVYTCLGLGLGAALVGGVFQSFSDFVMRGLMLAEPAGGMESMQQLNRTVFRSFAACVAGQNASSKRLNRTQSSLRSVSLLAKTSLTISRSTSM